MDYLQLDNRCGSAAATRTADCLLRNLYHKLLILNQTNKSIIFSLILYGYYLDTEDGEAKWVFSRRLEAEGWEKF